MNLPVFMLRVLAFFQALISFITYGSWSSEITYPSAPVVIAAPENPARLNLDEFTLAWSDEFDGTSQAPEYMILTSQVNGIKGFPLNGRVGDALTFDSEAPTDFVIDYVRVYQYNSGHKFSVNRRTDYNSKKRVRRHCPLYPLNLYLLFGVVGVFPVVPYALDVVIVFKHLKHLIHIYHIILFGKGNIS